MARADRFRLALAFTAICVIWGSTYLAIKVGLQSFDPFFYAGVRYGFAVVLSFALARARGVTFGGPLRRWLPAFGVGALLVAFCNGIVFWAETSLDSGFTAVLITTSPVWTALLSPASGERAPGPLGWAGIALGFAGTTVLLAPWQARTVTLWPARVSTSTYVNPVVAVTLGALVLGEAVSLRMVAGAAIILCGAALVLRERRAH